jgi:hypothetical protein
MKTISSCPRLAAMVKEVRLRHLEQLNSPALLDYFDSRLLSHQLIVPTGPRMLPNWYKFWWSLLPNLHITTFEIAENRRRQGFGRIPPSLTLQQLTLVNIDHRDDDHTILYSLDPILRLPALRHLSVVVRPLLSSSDVPDVASASLGLQSLAICFPPGDHHSITLECYELLFSKMKNLKSVCIERRGLAQCILNESPCSLEPANTLHWRHLSPTLLRFGHILENLVLDVGEVYACADAATDKLNSLSPFRGLKSLQVCSEMLA